MMSGMPLETCSAFNKFWNKKFYYKVASCWLFLLIHITMHGAVNINPLSPELNPICYLLALLAHDFLHVSRIRVKSLTLR
jgi:transposase